MSYKNIIDSNALFRQLLKKRQLTRFSLAAATLIMHAYFVGGIAFYRNFFARPLYEGATITIGIASAAAVILSFVILQLVYIVITARTLDPLQSQVSEKLTQEAVSTPSASSQSVEQEQFHD